MRKLILVIIAVFLASCEDRLPDNVLGISWKASESSVADLSVKEPRTLNLQQGAYEITPPVTDINIDDAIYIARFDDGKLSIISGYFTYLSTDKSEQIYNFYDALWLGQGFKKSELTVLPNAQKVCIDNKKCVLKSYKYAQDDLVTTISVSRQIDSLLDNTDSVYISYGRKSVFEKNRAKASK